MEFMTWLAATFPAGAVLSGVGVGTFVVAILSDRLLTKGQHLRRTADLVEHHKREMAEKDSRLALSEESRKEWKTTAELERVRADKVTATMSQVADSLDGVHYVLGSLDTSLKETKNG